MSNLELFNAAFPFAAECDPNCEVDYLQVQQETLVPDVYQVVVELVYSRNIPGGKDLCHASKSWFDLVARQIAGDLLQQNPLSVPVHIGFFSTKGGSPRR